MTTTTQQATWTCAGCSAERTKPEKRLPAGWKRISEEVLCTDCVGKRYVLRAVSIPVASPEREWKEFRGALKEMWQATTQASNWILTELYARDIRRSKDDQKMPPMPAIYLYPEIRGRFPQLPSQTVAALEQVVKKKYRAMRYKILWTCEAALPTYRYPAPFAIPNQGWSITEEDNRLFASVRIGDERWRLKLRGGHSFRRQRAAALQIISGEAIQGELALIESGDKVVCKMVAWLPRPQQGDMKGRSGILRVRTETESMIVALNEKDDKLWVYHADHLPGWVRQHKRQLDRWSDDTKAEQRPVPSFAERRTAVVEHQRRRMQNACHEIAAMIANYADRRKFASVRYDDTERNFCEQFPWFRLREMLKEKLDAHGIQFELASGEVPPKTTEPLAEE